MERWPEKQAALLVVDIQEKLFHKMAHRAQLERNAAILIQACTLFKMPIFWSEQYPNGLGRTVTSIQQHLQGSVFEKTAFSCLQDPVMRLAIESSGITTWLLTGIETHICLFQTALDLLKKKNEVIVVADATSSRHIHDYESALNELRAQGARISTTETLLFERIADAKHPLFKSIQQLIK